jgi:predicted lysophospholipase L1 biosynthesis ABC-type transport system permease subunit
MAYNADKAPIHIIVLFVFVVQLILAAPTSITYGSDNTAASKLTGKIALALLVINAVGAVFILCLKAQVPVQFGYYHIGLSLAIIYIMIKRATATGGWVWAKS